MKLTVLVKTKSKKESVETLTSGEICIRTNAPPVDGAANERIVELLAKHLNVAKSSIKIISGLRSRKKIVEVNRPSS